MFTLAQKPKLVLYLMVLLIALLATFSFLLWPQLSSPGEPTAPGPLPSASPSGSPSL